MRSTPPSPFTRRSLLLGVTGIAGGWLLAGCSKGPDDAPEAQPADAPGGDQSGRPSASPGNRGTAPVPVVEISTAHGFDQMWPHEPIDIAVTDGTIAEVKVTDTASGAVIPGSVTGGQWTADRGALRLHSNYRIAVTVHDNNDEPHTHEASATTVNPDMVVEVDYRFAGEAIGNGMPIWVRFDLPIPPEHRAAIEKTARITTVPEQVGSWGWVDENTLQWRPQTYWQAGSTAHVEVNAAGLPAGDTWIMNDAAADYRYGDLRVMKVNIDTHQMECYTNGQLVNTLPVSMGKPGYETMTGTKMVMDKFGSMVMDSSTYGVPASAAEGYQLTVYMAQRLTWSGEFFHAAPWADYAHGNSNVSHGCTGLSDANASWLFDYTQIGDPAEFTGSTFPVQPHQTWPAWVYSWDEWQGLSALA